MTDTSKITASHRERLCLVYLFSELQDNVAVQRPVQPRRRTANMPGNDSWLVYKGVTVARALLKPDMRC